MENNTFEKKWEKITRKVKKQWGKLTDDMTQMNRSYHVMKKRQKNTCHYQQEHVKKEIYSFLNNTGWSE